ncbi:MAG: tRNA (guanosine(37)-N1)-methyltransferase TrmD [Planctomycetes bacterium]|nr:tRNA (guanosine(37)-N1)-methyltransferase TrmD [Planctomycetota bacterium]
MKFDVLTLFPELIDAGTSYSILKRAREKGLINITTHNFRDFTTDKHQTVDDRPYGGGPGMVLKCEPIFDCIENITSNLAKMPKIIMLTPQGKTFDQKLAQDLSNEEHLLMLCGHYEGFDERIREGYDWDEISIGDYVISGGELASIVVIDAVCRLLPGVLGDDYSSDFESFEVGNVLDFPTYTRPFEFRGKKVPEILLSGNHEKVAKWRMKQSIERTKKRRPDLKTNENAILTKFLQLPGLQRERKKLKFPAFLNNKQKKTENKNINGENDGSAHQED